MFEPAPSGPKYGSGSTPPSRAVQRHRFFLGSIALHAGVLWTFAQWHVDTLVDATVLANSSRIQASTQAAERHGMRRHVDSLKTMKELMERIDRAQQPPDPSTQNTVDDLVQKDPKATPTSPTAKNVPVVQTPQEMLAQARTLRDGIQKIEQAARAKEMAKLLNISAQDALEKVRQQAQEQTSTEPSLDPSKVQTDEQVAQTLERYEQQARESVQQRQQQLAHQANGTQVAQTGAPGAASGDNHGPIAGAATAHHGGGGNNGRGEAAGAQSQRGSGGVDLNPRRFDAPLTPLPIDVANLRLGYGNVIGGGGAFANRVFVDRWYFIGPFDAPDRSSMQKVYPPELLVDLDAMYLGKFKHVLRWQYLSSVHYPLIPPVEAEQAMYYGYTELNLDKARDVWLAFGADDDAKAWVNDELVWTSGNQFKPWYNGGGFSKLKLDIQTANLNEARRLVHLNKGRNTILFKLFNSTLDVFMSLVVEPVPDPS